MQRSETWNPAISQWMICQNCLANHKNTQNSFNYLAQEILLNHSESNEAFRANGGGYDHDNNNFFV